MFYTHCLPHCWRKSSPEVFRGRTSEEETQWRKYSGRELQACILFTGRSFEFSLRIWLFMHSAGSREFYILNRLHTGTALLVNNGLRLPANALLPCSSTTRSRLRTGSRRAPSSMHTKEERSNKEIIIIE